MRRHCLACISDAVNVVRFRFRFLFGEIYFIFFSLSCSNILYVECWTHRTQTSLIIRLQESKKKRDKKTKTRDKKFEIAKNELFEEWSSAFLNQGFIRLQDNLACRVFISCWSFNCVMCSWSVRTLFLQCQVPKSGDALRHYSKIFLNIQYHRVCGTTVFRVYLNWIHFSWATHEP